MRIRTTRQARRLRPLATVLAARKKFWRFADRLLIERPYQWGTDEHMELYGNYMAALRVKIQAEWAYLQAGGDLNGLPGARVLD